MRLTQIHRAAFVRAVMNDVPSIDYGEQIEKLMRETALKAVPPTVRKLLADPSTREWVHHFQWTVSRFCSERRRSLTVSAWVPALQTASSLKLSDEALALFTRYQEHAEEREKLRENLTAAVNGCTTRRMLAELMPQFAKYLPSEVPRTRQLPAVTGVVEALQRAGWPKGGTAQQGAAA